MRPGFYHRLINGPFEDPCLLVRPSNERYSILFDAGDIRRLSHAEIWRIKDVFVTHTHVDHFIGIDTIIRVILRRDMPLNIYGPPDITRCMAGKLRGYAWNLIRDYPALINVFAYDGKTVSHSVFRAKNGFKMESVSRTVYDGILLEATAYKVRAVKLSHGIPCLAYSIEEDFHINIDKDVLLKKGLSVGPWLNDFKRYLRGLDGAERQLSIGGRTYLVGELSDIAIIKKGHKITYASDIAMTGKNISSLTALADGSNIFYCEAYYPEKDRERAVERFHLTARACGEIARKAGVGSLSVIHISPRYIDDPEPIIREAMEAFIGDTGRSINPGPE